MVIVPAKLVAVSVPPTPTPPVITNAPVVVLEEAVESPNNTLPEGAHSEYALVSVIFVPAAGAFAIYTVAAFVVVTVAFVAAMVG